MKLLKQIITILTLSTILYGCGLVGQVKEYQLTTEGFVTALMSNDYDKAVSYFDYENPDIGGLLNRDTLKAALPNLQEILAKNFGNKLKVKWISAEKKFTTVDKDKLPPNSVVAKATFEGDSYFGYLTFILGDKSGKIINVNVDDFKQPIPKTTNVYLFSILGLLVAAFNIFMIVKVVRSNVQKKWVRIITIILLNVPTIIYNAVSGLSIKLLNFQFLLGASFGFADYASTYCAIGIPIGALIVWWKFRNDLYPTEEREIPNDAKIIDAFDTENS